MVRIQLTSISGGDSSEHNLSKWTFGFHKRPKFGCLSKSASHVRLWFMWVLFHQRLKIIYRNVFPTSIHNSITKYFSFLK
jgi:hypothetical protein